MRLQATDSFGGARVVQSTDLMHAFYAGGVTMKVAVVYHVHSCSCRPGCGGDGREPASASSGLLEQKPLKPFGLHRIRGTHESYASQRWLPNNKSLFNRNLRMWWDSQEQAQGLC